MKAPSAALSGKPRGWGHAARSSASDQRQHRRVEHGRIEQDESSTGDVDDEAAPPEAVPAVPPGGWWGPLAQLVRTEVLVASGQVNRDRDCYQLGEWVRSGSAMAAFTLDRDLGGDLGGDELDDQTSPETRGRRHLTLHVVVAFAVEVADHAFTTDGVDWLYPEDTRAARAWSRVRPTVVRWPGSWSASRSRSAVPHGSAGSMA